MKPGISVMEPKKEANKTPISLLDSPRYSEISLSGTRKSTIETRMSIIKKAGKILIKLLAAILSALTVLSRFAIKEIITANPVAIYKKYTLPRLLDYLTLSV